VQYPLGRIIEIVELARAHGTEEEHEKDGMPTVWVQSGSAE